MYFLWGGVSCCKGTCLVLFWSGLIVSIIALASASSRRVSPRMVSFRVVLRRSTPHVVLCSASSPHVVFCCCAVHITPRSRARSAAVGLREPRRVAWPLATQGCEAPRSAHPPALGRMPCPAGGACGGCSLCLPPQLRRGPMPESPSASPAFPGSWSRRRRCCGTTSSSPWTRRSSSTRHTSRAPPGASAWPSSGRASSPSIGRSRTSRRASGPRLRRDGSRRVLRSRQWRLVGSAVLGLRSEAAGEMLVVTNLG